MGVAFVVLQNPQNVPQSSSIIKCLSEGNCSKPTIKPTKYIPCNTTNTLNGNLKNKNKCKSSYSQNKTSKHKWNSFKHDLLYLIIKILSI